MCLRLFAEKSIDETLDIFEGLGIEGAGIYCGGKLENVAHIDVDAVLNSPSGAADYLAALSKNSRA